MRRDIAILPGGFDCLAIFFDNILWQFQSVCCHGRFHLAMYVFVIARLIWNLISSTHNCRVGPVSLSSDPYLLICYFWLIAFASCDIFTSYRINLAAIHQDEHVQAFIPVFRALYSRALTTSRASHSCSSAIVTRCSVDRFHVFPHFFATKVPLVIKRRRTILCMYLCKTEELFIVRSS